MPITMSGEKIAGKRILFFRPCSPRVWKERLEIGRRAMTGQGGNARDTSMQKHTSLGMQTFPTPTMDTYAYSKQNQQTTTTPIRGNLLLTTSPRGQRKELPVEPKTPKGTIRQRLLNTLPSRSPKNPTTKMKMKTCREGDNNQPQVPRSRKQERTKGKHTD